MLIRIAVFISGAVLMALEILAFLINAKTFGSAWREVTAVIAVFLTAMSVGYWLGGRVGDKFPRPLTLMCSMGLGGVFVGIVPLIEPPITRTIFDSKLPLSTHALLASLCLYFLPALLLAMTSPIAIRLTAKSLTQTGSVAGGISALSTVGSIAGTMVTGFYLIDAFEVPKIVYLLGGVMMAMAALVGGVYRKQTMKVMTMLTCLMGLSSSAFAQQGQILFQRQTQYHHIIVAEEGGVRWLHFDNTYQSSMDPHDPLKGFLEYTDYFHCAFLFNEDLKDVLLVGLGGASVVKSFLHYYPKVNVDVAEIDPVVVEVAKNYFGLKTDHPRLKIHVMDGRVYIKKTEKKYDLIMLDAYAANRYGLTVPRHLVTKEFFQEIYDKLTPNGMMIYNIAANFTNYANRMTRAMHKTTAAVFKAQYTWDVETSWNTVLVCLKSPQTVTKEQLITRAKELVREGKVKLPEFVERVARLHTASYRASDVPLLTDNYAPVDSLMRGR
jgi:spermidine synthase